MKWYLILFVGSFLPKRFLMSFLAVVLTFPAFLHFVANENMLFSGSGYCFALGALAYHLKYAVPMLIQLTALALLPVFLFVLPRYFGLGAFDPPNIGRWLHFVIVPFLTFPRYAMA